MNADEEATFVLARRCIPLEVHALVSHAAAELAGDDARAAYWAVLVDHIGPSDDDRTEAAAVVEAAAELAAEVGIDAYRLARTVAALGTQFSMAGTIAEENRARRDANPGAARLDD